MSWIIKFSPNTWRKKEGPWGLAKLSPASLSKFIPFPLAPCSLCCGLPSIVRHAKLFPMPGPLHILVTLTGILFPLRPGYSHPCRICLYVTSSEEELSLTSSSFISSFSYFFPSWHFSIICHYFSYFVCFFLRLFPSLDYEFQIASKYLFIDRSCPCPCHGPHGHWWDLCTLLSMF